MDKSMSLQPVAAHRRSETDLRLTLCLFVYFSTRSCHQRDRVSTCLSQSFCWAYQSYGACSKGP